MKTIGMIGGMSWESTLSYYRLLNEGVKARLGGLHSAKICLQSVDFAEIETLQMAGKWAEAGDLLGVEARKIEAAGADFVMICTNTMHKVADQVAGAVSIPLLHIADATAAAVSARGCKKVGLLGTAFTMEQDFYKGRLADVSGAEVLIPSAADRQLVHDIIYGELCLGVIKPASRDIYLRVIADFAARGCEAVVAGCTEIGLLVSEADSALPLLDTTHIHVDAALEQALT